MTLQSLLQRVQMAFFLRALTFTQHHISLPVTTRNCPRMLSPTLHFTRCTSDSPSGPSSVQLRHLSVSSLSRARIVHPDTDTLIKYSLLHGPPRTPRVETHRTIQTARPPNMGAVAAIKNRVIDKVAGPIVSSHHHSPCRKGDRPVFDSVSAGLNLMDNQISSAENETHGPTRKTDAHYCALLAVVATSTLVGYLIRQWEASTRPIESWENGCHTSASYHNHEGDAKSSRQNILE
ncbi:hypothetical protein LZ32DRAFT_599663 [Colletotrichum eremochloae]|nr:hypothetical protein LZ32DRAFT_599663 [Colletotrichum eremochloae]